MKTFLKWLLRGFVFMAAVVVALFALDYVLPAGLTLGAVWILAIASAALSLMFSYFKSWRVDFAALPDTVKAWVNISAVVIVAVITFGLGCSGLLVVVGLECTAAGLQTLLTYVAVALVINQTFDHFSVDAPDVKALKAGQLDTPSA